MKRWILLLVLASSFSHAFAQGFADTLRLFFREFHLSVEAGCNYLLPSRSGLDDGFYYGVEFPNRTSGYGYFHHLQWNVAAAAENNNVKWHLALERDYLNTVYYGETFDVDYLRATLSLQFFILKKEKIHILQGLSVEWGWITRYDYTKAGITMHNPDIGQTYGVNLLFPLTVLFPITEHGRIYMNVAGGVHLRDDHVIPYYDHWGRHGYGPEAELRSYCPLSIGIGYGYFL